MGLKPTNVSKKAGTFTVVIHACWRHAQAKSTKIGL